MIDDIEMEKIVRKNHDTLTSMKPTFKRLDEIFKPDGQFENMCKQVVVHDTKINSNKTKIHYLIGTLVVLIVTLLTYLIVGG